MPENRSIYEKGFGRVAFSVMNDPRLEPESKIIYAWLAALKGEDEYCYPSLDYILQGVGMGRKRFYKYRRPLVELGYIVLKPAYNNKGRTSERYYLPEFPVPVEEECQNDTPPVGNGEVSKRHPTIDDTRGVKCQNDQCQNDQCQNDTGHFDTYTNTISNQYHLEPVPHTHQDAPAQARAEVAAAAACVREFDFEDWFKDFLAVYPKQESTKAQKAAAKKELRQAIADGEDPAVILAHAMTYRDYERTQGRAEIRFWKNVQAWAEARHWKIDYRLPEQTIIQAIAEKESLGEPADEDAVAALREQIRKNRKKPLPPSALCPECHEESQQDGGPGQYYCRRCNHTFPFSRRYID